MVGPLTGTEGQAGDIEPGSKLSMQLMILALPGSGLSISSCVMYLFISSFSRCSLLSIVVLFFNWHVAWVWLGLAWNTFFSGLLGVPSTEHWAINASDCVRVRPILAVLQTGGFVCILICWTGLDRWGSDQTEMVVGRSGLACLASAELKREIGDL